MVRRLAIAAIVLATAAHANSPEPSRETFAKLEATCTADGAFGHRFGEKNRKPDADAGMPPFQIESLSGNGPHDEVFEITAAASFAHAPMSKEDRIALAGWVVKKLDADIAASRKFTRQERRDGVAFIANSFVFDISRDGTTVRLTCTDRARKARAREFVRHQKGG